MAASVALWPMFKIQFAELARKHANVNSSIWEVKEIQSLDTWKVLVPARVIV